MSKKRFIPVSLFSVIVNKSVPMKNRWNIGNLFTSRKTFEDRQVGLRANIRIREMVGSFWKTLLFCSFNYTTQVILKWMKLLSYYCYLSNVYLSHVTISWQMKLRITLRIVSLKSNTCSLTSALKNAFSQSNHYLPLE